MNTIQPTGQEIHVNYWAHKRITSVEWPTFVSHFCFYEIKGGDFFTYVVRHVSISIDRQQLCTTVQIEVIHYRILYEYIQVIQHCMNVYMLYNHAWIQVIQNCMNVYTGYTTMRQYRHMGYTTTTTLHEYRWSMFHLSCARAHARASARTRSCPLAQLKYWPLSKKKIYFFFIN